MQMQDLTSAIRRRAYEIWLGEGCPHGRDRIHWLRAEAECREILGAERFNSRCKSGLHEKPVEGRTKTRKARQKVDKAAGRGEASEIRLPEPPDCRKSVCRGHP